MSSQIMQWGILALAAGMSIAGGVLVLFGLREQERADVAYALPADSEGYQAWYGHSRWAVHLASFGAALAFLALAYVGVMALMDRVH